MRKRMLSLILATIMVCTMCILPANAAETERTIMPRVGIIRTPTSGGANGNALCEFVLSENETQGMRYVTARTCTTYGENNLPMGSGSNIRLKIYDGAIAVFDGYVRSSASTGAILSKTGEVASDEANNAKADHYVYISGYGAAEEMTSISW